MHNVLYCVYDEFINNALYSGAIIFICHTISWIEQKRECINSLLKEMGKYSEVNRKSTRLICGNTCVNMGDVE